MTGKTNHPPHSAWNKVPTGVRQALLQVDFSVLFMNPGNIMVTGLG